MTTEHDFGGRRGGPRRSDFRKKYRRSRRRRAGDSPDWIAGYHPVREFLLKNPAGVSKILVSTRSSGLNEIISLARAAGIPFHFAPPEQLKSATGGNENIVAFVSRAPLLGIDDLRRDAATAGDGGLYVILDEITDTRNLGAIIRSAVCFGARGVVIQKWRSATLTGAVDASSAGAVSHIKVYSVPNVKHAISALKELSYRAVGSSSETAAKPLEGYVFPAKIALVIGSEEKGIRKTVAELCDDVVAVGQEKTVSSLNASVAAGILLYTAYGTGSYLRVRPYFSETKQADRQNK